MDKTGGIIKIVFENFCLTVPKNFVVEPFSPSLMSGIEKHLCFIGLCHDFPSKTFVSQYRNISYRKPSMLCFRKFLLAKKCMDEREGEI